MMELYSNIKRLTARDVTKALEENRRLELRDCDDLDLTKRAAAIVEQLDGLNYATACYLLDQCKDALKFTTIRADKIPV